MCVLNSATNDDFLFSFFFFSFQIGKTKVFLRVGQMAVLDAQRILMHGNSAKVIQTRGRTLVTRKKFVSTQMASICIQSVCRGENIGTRIGVFLLEMYLVIPEHIQPFLCVLMHLLQSL